MLFSFQKPVLPPPLLICVNSLVLFVCQSCNSNNALLVMKASSLLPSSPRVFCPLLSSSVLFPFFGKPSGFLRGSASYYCSRSGYKLLQECSPAILSRHGKTRANSVLRIAYRKRCYSSFACKLHTPWKGQKLLAQGIALGIIAISKAPCKGKSLIYCLDF